MKPQIINIYSIISTIKTWLKSYCGTIYSIGDVNHVDCETF